MATRGTIDYERIKQKRATALERTITRLKGQPDTPENRQDVLELREQVREIQSLILGSQVVRNDPETRADLRRMNAY